MGLFGGGKKKVREAAEGLGLTITEVRGRLMPIITGGGHMESLDPGDCIRLSLRRGTRSAPPWELLLRDKAHGAQLPNSYLVVTKGELPAPALLETLRPIAETFDTGYYEFEATETEIAVFFEESGDMDEFDTLYKIMVSLQTV